MVKGNQEVRKVTQYGNWKTLLKSGDSMVKGKAVVISGDKKEGYTVW